MSGIRIILFLWIVIVLTYLWRWHKRSRLPKNFKDICICGHRRITHISYANLRKKDYSTGKCDACECPEFVLSRKKKKYDSYFFRPEGPAYKVLHFLALSVTVTLAAILPRHIIRNWAIRLKNWADEMDRKTEETEEEKDEDALLPK